MLGRGGWDGKSGAFVALLSFAAKNLCGVQSKINSCFEILQILSLSRSVKNISASWISLEEEEEDDDEEVVEDKESTDIESEGEGAGDVFELFWC